MITTEIRGRKLTLDPIWTTQRNEQIPISEMNDEHLVNTIDMLNTRANEMGIEGGSTYYHNAEVLAKELVERAESRI